MNTLKNQTELSGMLGESVAVRKVGGRVVVTNRPKRQMGKPSDKQTIVQNKFLAASHYAIQEIELEESKALYATGITPKKRSAYMVALTDYLSAPKVMSIETLDYRGAIGDPIVVHVSDDFMVTKVKIVLTNAAGAIIEQAEVVPDRLRVILWDYKATAANPTVTGTKIRVVAYDRPGNKGMAEVVL